MSANCEQVLMDEIQKHLDALVAEHGAVAASSVVTSFDGRQLIIAGRGGLGRYRQNQLEACPILH